MRRLPIFITAFALFCSAAGAQELKLREDNIDQIVAAMTLEEKAHLVVGADMKKIDFAGEVGDTQMVVPGVETLRLNLFKFVKILHSSSGSWIFTFRFEAPTDADALS